MIGAITKEIALERLEKLPTDVRIIGDDASLTSITGALNLNATLIQLLGLILKQTIEGFPEDNQPCAHGQE